MFQVKTYKADLKIQAHQFYVLSKGENAGRPSKLPNVNSFVVSVDTAEERDQLFWLCYALWKGGNFYQYLRGSVVPFITIREFAHLLRQRQASTPVPAVEKVVSIMARLDEAEAAACKQLDAILKMKKLLLKGLSD